jgi:hypothetical protein
MSSPLKKRRHDEEEAEDEANTDDKRAKDDEDIDEEVDDESEDSDLESDDSEGDEFTDKVCLGLSSHLITNCLTFDQMIGNTHRLQRISGARRRLQWH